MNNLQPLNLLTNTKTAASGDNGDTDRSFADHQSRQMALASLFSSLSSLASKQQSRIPNQNHFLINQPNPPQASPPTTTTTPTTTTPTKNNLLANHQQQPAFSPTSSCPLSLTSSLQSVVAAAMMQQQLAATAAANQQQQQQQSQPPPPTANVFFPATDRPAGLFAPRLDQVDAQMAASCHLLNQQQQPQQQQRINYCTICNKELCNKYFMKTHMLKMHGINLEMEQPGDDGSDAGSSGEGEAANEQQPECKVQVKEEIGEGCSPSGQSTWCAPGQDNKRPKAANNKKTNKSTDGKKSANKPPASNNNQQQQQQQSNQKQATSVMNGFAGNSMGGVVCDICNKELCSKYFLKVHKQNTHGIMTDYQDPSQFIYPFGQPGPAPLPFPPNPFALFGGQQAEPSSSPAKKPAKRARVSSSKSGGTIETEGDGCFTSHQQQKDNKQQQQQQFESVYRLLLAKQQPLGGHCGAMGQQQAPAFDPTTSANPLASLMCFGAMGPALGPFGAAPVMSAAMVVDNILRNQHLFNRAAAASNTNQDQQLGQNDPKQTSQLSGGNKGKDQAANGSRYFSHYTEACPMCDRRFKSIKWLKTHMMNDHKQEIGAYMQMMMQYVYTGKSQQQQQQQQQMMMLEQQQRHQQMAQHLMANSNNGGGQATNLINNFAPPNCHQAHSLLAPVTEQPLASSNPFYSTYLQPRLPHFATAAATSPASSKTGPPTNCQQTSPIDARRGESLSPGGSFTGLSCLDLDSNNNNRSGGYLRVRDSPPWDDGGGLSYDGVGDGTQDSSSIGHHNHHHHHHPADDDHCQQPQIKSSD